MPELNSDPFVSIIYKVITCVSPISYKVITCVSPISHNYVRVTDFLYHRFPISPISLPISFRFPQSLSLGRQWVDLPHASTPALRLFTRPKLRAMRSCPIPASLGTSWQLERDMQFPTSCGRSWLSVRMSRSCGRCAGAWRAPVTRSCCPILSKIRFWSSISAARYWSSSTRTRSRAAASARNSWAGFAAVLRSSS